MRRALDEVGGWDERYFMYLEDVDLCWRLRGAGWEITYEPAGVVDHVQGASTARTPYRMLAEHHRSAWRFARRRFTGARALVLPFAAVYLARARCPGDGCARLARAENRGVHPLAWPAYGQVFSDETTRQRPVRA